MDLWYTNLILVTSGRLGDLFIASLMANLPYLSDFKPSALPRGLEDGPVVHQLDHDHLGEVRRPHHWLSHGQHVVYGSNILPILAFRAFINSLDEISLQKKEPHVDLRTAGKNGVTKSSISNKLA